MRFCGLGTTSFGQPVKADRSELSRRTNGGAGAGASWKGVAALVNSASFARRSVEGDQRDLRGGGRGREQIVRRSFRADVEFEHADGGDAEGG